MKDVLETLERWVGEGLRFATATVVRTERSAPRDPGAVLAVSEKGEVAGSVTGGCVEPAVYEEALAILDGGPPKLLEYGIADEEAFEVGLPCGGTVHIFVDTLDPALVAPIAAAIRDERPVALAFNVDGASIGEKHLVYGDAGENGEVGEKARGLLARGQTGFVTVGEEEVFVSSFAPRPKMYVFGAIDFASTLASIGRFMGYHVTVCDARAKFVTPERFPDVDELVVDWPDRFLAIGSGRRANCDLRAHPRREVRRPHPEARALDECRLHRRHGLAANDRATLRAAARGGRDGRGSRARARADRPPDRLAQPGGGRHRDRGRDHLGVQREDAARLGLRRPRRDPRRPHGRA